ncbi:MAG: threonine ammonia-lyase [Planctomycetaceae bacterium]
MRTTDPIAPARLSIEQIREADDKIRRYVHRTPLVRSNTLSHQLGAEIYLKLECLQKTGSFKPRGAFNKLLSLTSEQKERGVVGVSGGNHAQGLAYAARELGVRASICMPSSTPQNYLDATRGYGANVVLCSDIRDAFATAEQLCREGLVAVHPFDDPWVAAGQGTIALEILQDLPDVSRVYISIGGGGLIAGMATALRHARPDIRIIGVETRGADVMSRSVAAGELIEMPAITSIARTLGAPKVSPFTLDHVQSLVDELMVVEDDETIDAMQLLLERTKYLVEPAAACCLAAARRHAGLLRAEDRVAILLCGGNVALSDLTQWYLERQSRVAGS